MSETKKYKTKYSKDYDPDDWDKYDRTGISKPNRSKPFNKALDKKVKKIKVKGK
jgi:hypothetical protein